MPKPDSARLISLALVALIVIAAGFFFLRAMDRFEGPDPETVAVASLKGMREQNRLSAFAANYAAVVTTSQTRFGLSAKKTLIMNGLVRYEVDLAKLGPDDVRWDPESSTLSVRLPPVEVDKPQIDLGSVQEYGDNGLLRRFTDVDEVLDKANRAKGVKELTRQAQEPVPMRLAREAHRRAVAQNFAAPMRAAGLDAEVDVFFSDEPRDKVTTRWDLSRPLKDLYAEDEEAR